MPRISLKGGKFDAEKFARDSERAEYVRQAEERARPERQARIKALEDFEPAYAEALALTRALTMRPSDVLIRDAGIFTTAHRQMPPWMHPDATPWPRGWDRSRVLQEDRKTRPPLTRLIDRGSSALNTWLAMVYVLNSELTGDNRHPTTNPGTGVEPWSKFAGQWETQTAGKATAARRARMARDLNQLKAAKIIRLGKHGAHRTSIEKFKFLTEDALRAPYSAPRTGVALPGTFWLNGWHLVLKPQEIAAFLMVRHAWHNRSLHLWSREWGLGVRLTTQVRWRHYGVTSETYEALHELEEFGLVSMFDPMPERRRGRFDRAKLEARVGPDEEFAPVPYEWRDLGDDVFAQDALQVVNDKLNSHELPLRMRDPLDFFNPTR